MVAIGAVLGYLGLVFVSTIMIPVTDVSAEPWGPLGPIVRLLTTSPSYVETDCMTGCTPADPVTLEATGGDGVALLVWVVVLVGVGTFAWHRRDVD